MPFARAGVTGCPHTSAQRRGPRQRLDGSGYDCTLTPHQTIVRARFEARASELTEYLPPGFTLREPANLALTFAYLTEVDWLAGRGYSTFGVSIPAAFHGREARVDGELLLVLWENMADPIITGREELGFSKVYCELPAADLGESAASCRASWDGFQFASLQLSGLRREKPERLPQSAASAGLLHYRYFPRTGAPGEADVEQVVLTPAATPNLKVTDAWVASEAAAVFHKATWEELPTLRSYRQRFGRRVARALHRCDRAGDARRERPQRSAGSRLMVLERSAATFETRPFVGGGYRRPHGTGVFETVNPATATVLAEFPDCDAQDIDAAVTAARAAFRSAWRRTAPQLRKDILLRVAASIRRARDELALLDSLEMGMPISLARAQVDEAADYTAYNAELADKVNGDVAPADPAHVLAMSWREPRGVVGVISPWNYPLITAISAIAPALATGNTVVVKPSEHAPSSLLKLAGLAHDAGLPAGALNVIPGLGPSTGAALASHADIDLIHFIGSTAVGRRLQVYSGTSNGKPVMIEAGGKSAQIVFEDAVGIEGLAAALAEAAFANTGQLCVARSRLIVHESLQARIVEEIAAAVSRIYTIGDPLGADVNFGPIASRAQFQRVTASLDSSRAEGVEPLQLAARGKQPSVGYFMHPSLILNARNDMRIAREEIFGPVLAVLDFRSEEEAISLANDVSYGLAATAWTSSLPRARRLARELDAGRVDIRSSTRAGAPLRMLAAEPFGASGHGVMGGVRGLDPFVRRKAVQFICE